MRVRILSFLLGACLAMFGSCSLAEEATSDAYVWNVDTASINIDRVSYYGNDYGVTLTYWKDPFRLLLTDVYPADTSTENLAVFNHPREWLLTIPRVRVGATVYTVVLELWPQEDGSFVLELVCLDAANSALCAN